MPNFLCEVNSLTESTEKLEAHVMLEYMNVSVCLQRVSIVRFEKRNAFWKCLCLSLSLCLIRVECASVCDVCVCVCVMCVCVHARVCFNRIPRELLI